MVVRVERGETMKILQFPRVDTPSQTEIQKAFEQLLAHLRFQCGSPSWEGLEEPYRETSFDRSIIVRQTGDGQRAQYPFGLIKHEN